MCVGINRESFIIVIWCHSNSGGWPQLSELVLILTQAEKLFDAVYACPQCPLSDSQPLLISSPSASSPFLGGEKGFGGRDRVWGLWS